jgi:hypothetical protein
LGWCTCGRFSDGDYVWASYLEPRYRSTWSKKKAIAEEGWRDFSVRGNTYPSFAFPDFVAIVGGWYLRTHGHRWLQPGCSRWLHYRRRLAC